MAFVCSLYFYAKKEKKKKSWKHWWVFNSSLLLYTQVRKWNLSLLKASLSHIWTLLHSLWFQLNNTRKVEIKACKYATFRALHWMLTYIMTRNYQIKHALCVGPMSYLILLLKTFPKCALNNTIYMFRKPQGSYNESWKLHNRMKIVRINGKKKKK